MRWITVLAFVAVVLAVGGCRQDGDAGAAAPDGRPPASSAVGSAPAKPSPTAPATPRATTPPVALGPAMLRPSDFGAGYTIESETPLVSPDSSLLGGVQCPEWQPAGEASTAHVLGGHDRLFDAPRGHFDGQSVWRFDGEWAVTAMRELRDQLRICARAEFREVVDFDVVTRTILASGIAGADSLIVRDRHTRNGLVSNVDFYVVVRQGELVAVLWLSDQRWTVDRMRDVGRRMATRLCAATDAC